MATNAEQPISNNLQLTGQAVLVENPLGIFYGILEKSDTRSGTALLSNGFMISSDKHITFSQYIDFLFSEIEGAYFDWLEHDERENPEIGVFDELQIDWDTYQEHARTNTITDYASEGICLTQLFTTTHSNRTKKQEFTSLISLSNVLGIVVISSEVKENTHRALQPVAMDASDIFSKREESPVRAMLDEFQGPATESPDLFDASRYSALETFQRLQNDSMDILPELVVSTRRRKESLSTAFEKSQKG